MCVCVCVCIHVCSVYEMTVTEGERGGIKRTNKARQEMKGGRREIIQQIYINIQHLEVA